MCLRLAVGALGASVAIGVAPASATPTEPCTLGDAREQFETFPLTFEGIPPCQYRLFFNGQTFTFSEEDFFLAGAVRRVSYDPSVEGSRDAAIAVLDNELLRSWIAEVTASGVGPLVEQPLMRTAVKSGQNEQFGTYVWHQRGFIAQLPPGQYVNVTRLANGNLSTVHLIITPTA